MWPCMNMSMPLLNQIQNFSSTAFKALLSSQIISLEITPTRGLNSKHCPKPSTQQTVIILYGTTYLKHYCLWPLRNSI